MVTCVQFDSVYRLENLPDILWVDEICGTLRHTASRLMTPERRAVNIDRLFDCARVALLCVATDRSIGQREVQWAADAGASIAAENLEVARWLRASLLYDPPGQNIVSWVQQALLRLEAPAAESAGGIVVLDSDWCELNRERAE